MYTRYGIAYADSIDELVEQINNLLKDGWTIYGSMGIDTNTKGDKVYFHEMVIEQLQNFE